MRCLTRSDIVLPMTTIHIFFSINPWICKFQTWAKDSIFRGRPIENSLKCFLCWNSRGYWLLNFKYLYFDMDVLNIKTRTPPIRTHLLICSEQLLTSCSYIERMSWESASYLITHRQKNTKKLKIYKWVSQFHRISQNYIKGSTVRSLPEPRIYVPFSW